MRSAIGALCLATAFVAATALADMAPTPDRGPPLGDAAGLSFAIQSVQVAFGPAGGPHYYKSEQVVVLTGCADATPNCALARSKSLIGMEVASVAGVELSPEIGMVRQILDAFAAQDGKSAVSLRLYTQAENSQPLDVAFAKR